MKVAVGSKNPVKVNATKNILEKIYDNVEVISIDVDSEVPHQPFGIDKPLKEPSTGLKIHILMISI